MGGSRWQKYIYCLYSVIFGNVQFIEIKNELQAAASPVQKACKVGTV